MSKSIWDVRFGNQKMAQDTEEGSWITVNGAHVMVNESGDVVKGARGRLNPDVVKRAETLKKVSDEITDGAKARRKNIEELVKIGVGQYKTLEKKISSLERAGKEVPERDRKRLEYFDNKIHTLNESINNGDYMFNPDKAFFCKFSPMLSNGERNYDEATDSAENARYDFFKTLNADIYIAQNEGRSQDVKNMKESGFKALDKNDAAWWNKHADEIDDYKNGIAPRIRGLNLKILS